MSFEMKAAVFLVVFCLLYIVVVIDRGVSAILQRLHDMEQRRLHPPIRIGP